MLLISRFATESHINRNKETKIIDLGDPDIVYTNVMEQGIGKSDLQTMLTV